MPQRIRFRSVEDLLYRCWDDETIVFNPGSGNTHLLNVLAADALRLLERGPMDALELHQRLESLYEADSSNLPPEGTLAALLIDFEQLGLIEPVCEN